MHGALIWMVSSHAVFGKLGETKLCDDTVGFVDAKNRSCTEWLGLACDNAAKDRYSVEEANELWSNCGTSCERPCSEKTGFFKVNREISYRSHTNTTMSNSGRTISLHSPDHRRGLAILEGTIQSVAFRVPASRYAQSIALFVENRTDDGASNDAFASLNDTWASVTIASRCNDAMKNFSSGPACAGGVTWQLMVRENRTPDTNELSLKAAQRIVLKCENVKLNVLVDSVVVHIFNDSHEACEEGMVVAFELEGENNVAVTGITVIIKSQLGLSVTAIAWSVMLFISVSAGILFIWKSKQARSNDADAKFKEEAAKARATTLASLDTSKEEIPAKQLHDDAKPSQCLAFAPCSTSVKPEKDTSSDNIENAATKKKSPEDSLSRVQDMPVETAAWPVRRRSVKDDRSFSAHCISASPRGTQSKRSKVAGLCGSAKSRSKPAEAHSRTASTFQNAQSVPSVKVCKSRQLKANDKPDKNSNAVE